MANGYIHIEKDCFTEKGMTFAEAAVYSLVAGYVNNGQRFIFKLDDLAKDYNISKEGMRLIVDRLSSKGFLHKTRNQYGLEITLSNDWKNAETKKVRFSETKKVGRRNQESLSQETKKVGFTPYIINNSNKPNKGEIDEKYGILVECFTSTFKEAFGREYAPNFSTFSTAANNVCDNLVTAMKNDGYAYTPDTLRAYATQWFQLALRNSDDWHRERYSMEFVSSQFNYYNNQVNNNNGHTTRQQTNDGISDEYIRQQFEKIARARAKRQSSADGGDCAAQRR